MIIASIYQDPDRKARLRRHKSERIIGAPAVTKRQVAAQLTGEWQTSREVSAAAFGTDYTEAHRFRVSSFLDRLAHDHIAQRLFYDDAWHYAVEE